MMRAMAHDPGSLLPPEISCHSAQHSRHPRPCERCLSELMGVSEALWDPQNPTQRHHSQWPLGRAQKQSLGWSLTGEASHSMSSSPPAWVPHTCRHTDRCPKEGASEGLRPLGNTFSSRVLTWKLNGKLVKGLWEPGWSPHPTCS